MALALLDPAPLAIRVGPLGRIAEPIRKLPCLEKIHPVSPVTL